MKTHCLAFLALWAAGAMAHAPAAAGAPQGGSADPQASAAGPASAAPGEKPLQAGDLAPDFALAGSDGRTHRLADFKGKRAVVIAWFPKAFTSG